MPLTPLPPRPVPGSETFEADAGALLDALPVFGDELNALQEDVSAKQELVAADRVQTGQDRAQTAQDRTQTGQDRTQTGLDRTATANSQAGALSSKNAAAVSAGQSSDNAAAVLSIYGTTAVMQAKLDEAKVQSSAAQTAVASASSVLQQDLSAVSAAALHRSPNAIAAQFIYDTSLDSDGGAWVERMQHASWYNEPLCGAWRGQIAGAALANAEATARAILGAATGDYFQYTGDGKFYKLSATTGTTEVFRGNKAKSSRVPLAIGESSSVTVFDATEPGRPMWGRWVFASGTFGTITSLAGLQGKLLVGTTLGLITLDFARDEGRFQQASSDRTFRLTERASGSQTLVPRAAQVLLVNSAVNAAAITVLPDAPIDASTGLQVPTIAVATAGGVSVIKHDGTAVNSSETTETKSCAMAGPWLYLGSRYAVTAQARFQDLRNISAGWTATAFSSPSLLGGASDAVFITLAGRLLHKRIVASARIETALLNKGAPGKSVNAVITDTFSTGYMFGDIRRCYLSSVEAGSIASAELVINGGFDVDANWAKAAGVAITGSAAGFDGTQSYAPSVYLLTSDSFTTVVGKTYEVTWTITSSTTNLVSANASGGFSGAPQSLAGTYKDRFVATQTSTAVNIITRSSVGVRTGGVDSISVKEVIADRSCKGAGASIAGTLVKTAVATAAQLVAYSGFGSVNYAQEPYSADLDFGTGDVSLGAFLNIPSALPLGSFPVISAEICTGGAMDSATGFTLGEGWAMTGGTASRAAASTYSNLTWNTLSVIGKTYLISVDISAISGAVFIGAGGQGQTFTTTGTKTFMAAAANTGGAFVQCTTASGTVTVDNLSVKEVGPSVVCERSAATGAYFRLTVDGIGRVGAAVCDGVTLRTALSSASYANGAWFKARMGYSAGKLAVLVNEAEVASVTGAALLTLSNAAAVLTIGNTRTLDAPFPGSLALLHLGATLPSAEQGAWACDQERRMFQDGAQVALPSSAAVIDLSYDEALDKWAALQAGNESSFTGLIRTANVTPGAGSFSKVNARSGIKLQARTTTNPGVDVTIPAYGLREELVRRAEAAAKASKTLTVFDFDAVAAQTDFVLPVGWTATEVIAAGASQREGATKNYTRLFDGFRETIRFAVAPGAAAWIQINARKE